MWDNDISYTFNIIVLYYFISTLDLDFNCSLEFEENVAYLLVYKKGNPSPSGSSCKKGKTKLALDVSKPYTCSANNTFFYHTCIVSLKHGKLLVCFCIFKVYVSQCRE